jgi:hypothetical protein
MTASTQGLTAQGLAGSQQGTFTPGFPPAIGPEQYLGTTQQYGFPGQGWPQAPYGIQPPYGQPPWSSGQGQFGGQGQPGFGQGTGQLPQHQIEQVFQQFIGQILPMAQQVILPQVIALAVQQVQQQVQQLVTQLVLPQLTGQQHPWMSQAGQFSRPYSMFS